MATSSSIWTGDDFPKAPDSLPNGNRITSAQYNSFVNAFNQRLTSGLGDGAWRIAWSFFSFWRDLVSRDSSAGYSFARADEWFQHWALLDDGNTSESLFGGDTGRRINSSNPMFAFRDGWRNINGEYIQTTIRDFDGQLRTTTLRSEKDRFGGLKVAKGTAKENWNAMKTPRGVISQAHANERAAGCATVTDSKGTYAIRIKPQDLHGFQRGTIAYAAREILQLPRQISGYYGWLKAYGGRIVPTEVDPITCAGETARLDPNTPSGDGTDPEFPDLPTPPTEPDTPTPVVPTGNLNDFNDSFQDNYLAQGGVNVNAPAFDFFQHARGTHYETLMAEYLAEYRGLHPIGDPSNYVIRNSAVDFDRMLRSQYLFAPAHSYPALSTTTIQAPENFIIGGVLVEVDEVKEEDIDIELTTNLGTQNIRIPAGQMSAVTFFPGGAVASVSSSSPLPSGVSGEVYIAFKMRPEIYDLYAVMRVRNDIPEGNRSDKFISDEYFSSGALHGGAFADADRTDSLELFPPYRTMKRFTNSLMRLINFDRLIGYEVVTERDDLDDEESDMVQKSVLYFNKDGLNTAGFDMFSGLHGKRISKALRRGLTNEWVFGFAGSCPADGDDKADSASQGIFKVQSYAQIRGCFVNPFYIGSYAMSKPYTTNAERRIATDSLKARRKNFGYLLRGYPSDGLGVGQFQLYPEAPSGLNNRYNEDAVNQGFGQGANRAAAFRSSTMHTSPYLIDEISILEGQEFLDAFPDNGKPNGTNLTGDNRTLTSASPVRSGQVIKVKLNSRLRPTEKELTRLVGNNGTDWNAYSADDRFVDGDGNILSNGKTFGAGITAFFGERSDENRIIELLQYRWQTYASGTSTQPPRRLGDFAPSAVAEPTSTAFPLNKWGSVFSRFYFVKLLPRAFEDDNVVVERTDTRIYSHLFRQAEFYLRSVLCAYFDPDTNNNNHQVNASGECEYKFPPADYTMERLLTKRVTETRQENLAIRKLEEQGRISAPSGPPPNVVVSNGFFNEYAKSLNALQGVTIPNFPAIYSRSSQAFRQGLPPLEFDDADQLEKEAPGIRIERTPRELWTIEGLGVFGSSAQLLTPWSAAEPPRYTPVLPPGPLDFDEVDGQVLAPWQQANGAIAQGLFIITAETNHYAITKQPASAEWRAIGTDEYLQAFLPTLRAYIIKNGLGVLYAIRRGVRGVRGWREITNSIDPVGPSNGRYSARENRTVTYGPVTCQVGTGAILHSPPLPSSLPATVDRFYGEALGEHRSEIEHLIAPAKDAVLVVDVENTDFGAAPVCELIPSGSVSFGFYYEVQGGSGVIYGTPNQLTTYLDGDIFAGAQRQESAGVFVPITEYEQVDEDNPSQVCRRRDLGTPE